MDEQGISKFALERIEAAHERSNRRLWIIILILLVMVIGTITGAYITIKINNDKWSEILSEYDFESYEVEADGGSVAAYAGETIEGDINNGGKDKSAESN